MYTESQIPRSKLRGIKLVSQQSCGVFDPRGSRQMDMQACPLGSLPAGIKKLKKYLFRPRFFTPWFRNLNQKKK